ncbi:hypothetical protein BDW22DRAFT_1266740 [Trametopsis cervina]|nr:hypothetical protein BDW22DRAFT_1266740 [Trametopsis cervina]
MIPLSADSIASCPGYTILAHLLCAGPTLPSPSPSTSSPSLQCPRLCFFRFFFSVSFLFGLFVCFILTALHPRPSVSPSIRQRLLPSSLHLIFSPSRQHPSIRTHERKEKKQEGQDSDRTEQSSLGPYLCCPVRVRSERASMAGGSCRAQICDLVGVQASRLAGRCRMGNARAQPGLCWPAWLKDEHNCSLQYAVMPLHSKTHELYAIQYNTPVPRHRDKRSHHTPHKACTVQNRLYYSTRSLELRRGCSRMGAHRHWSSCLVLPP